MKCRGSLFGPIGINYLNSIRFVSKEVFPWGMAIKVATEAPVHCQVNLITYVMAQLRRRRCRRADVAEGSSLGPANELGPRRFGAQSDHLVRFAAAPEHQVHLPINKNDA